VPLHSRTQSPCFESVFSISSPGFQKSRPGFVKHESGFFSSPGPGFPRVRIFFESGSESGPGFEVCQCERLNRRLVTNEPEGQLRVN
jgi:hypothetical protein